ncbi:MAG: hypothetical protein LAT55_00825 [Opitutales bacterium]|nr:hypothetical protein [Opitutales bacterium]
MSQSTGKNFPKEQSNLAKPSEFQPYATALKIQQGKNSAKSGGPEEDSGKKKPKVQVVDEDGIVKKIRVTCSCGELIEIDCSYD